MIGYALFDTAIGACGIAWGERGVVGALAPRRRTGRSPPAHRAADSRRARARAARSDPARGRVDPGALRGTPAGPLGRFSRHDGGGRLRPPRVRGRPAHSRRAKRPPTASSPRGSAIEPSPARWARRSPGIPFRSSSPATACWPPEAGTEASPRPEGSGPSFGSWRSRALERPGSRRSFLDPESFGPGTIRGPKVARSHRTKRIDPDKLLDRSWRGHLRLRAESGLPPGGQNRGRSASGSPWRCRSRCCASSSCFDSTKKPSCELVGCVADCVALAGIVEGRNPRVLLLDRRCGATPRSTSSASFAPLTRERASCCFRRSRPMKRSSARCARARPGVIPTQCDYATLVRAIRAVSRGEIWANRRLTARALERSIRAGPIPRIPKTN